MLVHKFKTQISALLQGRTTEERWAAVVLIKATVEAGGWEVLSGSGAWVRGLLGILGKPDPSSTKKLCITALTRIFFLTQEHQTLVRELTTPSLPAFINSCINLITSKESSGIRQLNTSSPLLSTVLEALNRLLPRHPTIFRPSRTEINTLLLPLIAPTPSTTAAGEGAHGGLGASALNAGQVRHSAQCLFVRLHYCAPKNASAEEWKKEFETVIRNTHTIANQVFRAIIEDWEPMTDTLSHRADPGTFHQVVSDAGTDLMHLPTWSGIEAGIERLIGVLDLLETYLTLPSSSSVSVRVDYVMDLLTRIFSSTVPSDREGWQAGVRLNQEIGREEREALWSRLPEIHVAAMNVLLGVIRRLAKAFIPMAQGSLDQLVWVFKAENWSVNIRTTTYTVLKELLQLTGPSLSKSALLSKVIQSCCEDLLPLPAAAEGSTSSLGSKDKSAQIATSSANADSYLRIMAEPPSISRTGFPGLKVAASDLLPHFLTDLPASSLSFPLRSRVDRTAVLIQHQKAMLASVLNPPPVRSGGKVVSSILPFLARSDHAQLETEGTIRPRMPVIKGRSVVAIGTESDSEDELRDEEDNTDHAMESRSYNLTLDESSVPGKPTLTEVKASGLDVTRYPGPPVAAESPSLLATTSPKTSKRDHDTFSAASGQPQLVSTSESLPTKRPKANASESFTSAVEEAMPNPPEITKLDNMSTTENTGLVPDTVIQPSIPTSVPAGKPFVGDAEGDSDDDFEIPPLTMEADTEDEDEDEDEPDEMEN